MIFILYVNGAVFLYEGMQGVGRKENGVAKNSVQRTSERPPHEYPKPISYFHPRKRTRQGQKH